MKKKKDDDYSATVIFFLLSMFIGFIFGVVSYSLDNTELEKEKSTIYTSCFDQYDVEHLVSYEVPSYKVKEELKNQIINIYCPQI